MNNTQAGARADSFSTTVTCLSVKAYKTSYPKYLSISPQKFLKNKFHNDSSRKQYIKKR